MSTTTVDYSVPLIKRGYKSVTELLTDPNNWIQLQTYNSPLGTYSARKCCLLGALVIIFPHDSAHREAIINSIVKDIDNSVINFNDTHTHEEVLALCKKLNI